MIRRPGVAIMLKSYMTDRKPAPDGPGERQGKNAAWRANGYFPAWGRS